MNAHAYVLKDSLSYIRHLESLSFSPTLNILLTPADVVAALYPSIYIEDSMRKLQWFMAQHSKPVHLQPKYLQLARFVLENNYVTVECKGY
jgi:hypothetical protein